LVGNDNSDRSSGVRETGITELVRVAGAKPTAGVFQAIEEVVHWDVNKSK